MRRSFTAAVLTALISTVVAVSSADQYGIAYNLQTGPILYASMPLLPPSSISATNTAPLYATSAANIATTYLGQATIVTTVTQAATYSFASHANTVRAEALLVCKRNSDKRQASAAPTDESDMAKFLKRWKDDE